MTSLNQTMQKLEQLTDMSPSVEYDSEYGSYVEVSSSEPISEEEADLMRGRMALFSSDSFQSAIRAAFESAVEQAVAAGVITQAQADLILENTPDLGGFGGFGGFHGPGGFGHHGHFGGGPGSSLSPQAPSTTPTNDT